MAKHAKEKKSNLFFYRILLVLFIIVAIISLVSIIKWCLNNKENAKIENQLTEMISIDNKDGEEAILNVNFNKLKEINEDTIAWLSVNGTKVNYAVVKASDNSYYLNHNFNKNSNKLGWVFTDYKNKFDGTDKNIIIYGHNAKNGSMFGSLINIIKEDWYDNEDNYEITLITENEKVKYQVFSVYQTEAEDYYIQTNFKNDESYEEFLKTLEKRSLKDFDVDLTSEDTILTLSTCGNSSKYRIVLHAKKIIGQKLY